ncbi:ATP-binding protein [Alkalihalobacillus sp. R86527]|uniref:ATP-binding protein n=1 Tax=Alkalihalobacillus sp. R86527 TaxID=3093863 RepID=UPI003671E769
MKAASLREIVSEQDKKATKLFLYLFALVTIVTSIYKFAIEPKLPTNPGTPSVNIDEWIYIGTELILIIIGFYLIKISKSYAVKYVFLIVYLVVTLVTEITIYSLFDITYSSGGVMEIFFVFFTPIFLNRKYFMWVTAGMIIKYIIVGSVLLLVEVLFPITLLGLISIITYIYLNRSLSFVTSIEKAYEKLAHHEKLAFMGQVATGIAHEIRNPLTSIKGFLQLQQYQTQVDTEHSSIMMDELERINLIVNDLLILGKPNAFSFHESKVDKIIDYVVKLTINQAAASGVTLEVEINSELSTVWCDGNRLKQVFINIIRNAIDAMSEGGIIKITADNYSENEIKLSFSDEGNGIPDEFIDRLQEPFFSTKESGTGLGLMVSYRIIEEHNGRIEVESMPEVGTTFHIFLPSTN